jgi:predicted extracellular nuclease
MFKLKTLRLLGALTTLGACAGANASSIQITEWMYNGNGAGSLGEFVEFTNTGAVAINMNNWSFDDNSRAPGSQSLSAFGSVSPGESVIFTDDTAANFRSNWSLAASVKIIGGNSNNLGRADEINLYDAGNALLDRLTYDDQTIAGSVRTNGLSANIIPAKLGANQAGAAVKSVVGDSYGSYASSLGEIGNPGKYPAPVPLPAAAWLLVSGLGLFGSAARRRSGLPREISKVAAT